MEQESKLKDRFGRSTVPDVTATVVDAEKYPRFHEAKPVYIVQETGDAIFVPSGWYHQVRNLEDTLSINHNWFNGYNIRDVWSFLQREYAAVKKELEDLGLPAHEFVHQCQLVMLANTGINYVEFRELLYAKAKDMLLERERLDTSEKSRRGKEMRLHLGHVREILWQLNAALDLVDNAREAKVDKSWTEVDAELEALCNV
ncbi:hypothetical protein PsorP6_014841 [Peronosclerospora sorghi]|uniref:Uncharacterized protein n=1 Tax=Peronosclerospora sorghi TaxID=230839 RepID=A0ACC0VUJ9_9STRA|nr:hypothetical protein PsorP6_014841 [Peronosclerospora sorghi]